MIALSSYYTVIWKFYHILHVLSGIGSGPGCLATISTPFLIKSRRSSRRGNLGLTISFSTSFSFFFSTSGAGLQLGWLLQLQGLQGVHGWQTGHEQQDGGGGGGGGLHGLQPPEQQDPGHLGGHIHQIVQGWQEHPLHGLQQLNWNFEFKIEEIS